MKILLNDGHELNPLLVTGGTKAINGVNRDTLNFVFSADTSLDYADAAFTDSNCETIKLYEDVVGEDGSTYEVEHVHTGYTVRAGLSRTPVVVKEATEDTDAVVEQRVIVSMALRTYAEAQLAKLAASSAMHEECLVELANIIYA